MLNHFIRRSINDISIASVLFTLILMNSCSEIEARDEANAGKDELISCHFEWAREHFEQAYDLKPQNTDITLGLAISKTLELTEKKDINRIIHQLGFTQSVTEYCHTLSDDDNNSSEYIDDNGCTRHHYSQSIPHPCDDDSSCDYVDYIDQSLTLKEISDTLYEHREELLSISRLFQFASESINDHYSIAGIPGFGEIHLNAADLTFISALVRTLVVCTEILQFYDVNFPLKDILSLDTLDCESKAQWYNRHLVIKSTGSKFDSDKIVRLFMDVTHQLYNISMQGYSIRWKYDENIRDNPCYQRDFLFHWEKVPYGIYKNIENVTKTFENEPFIGTDFIEPVTEMDIRKFMTEPPYRSTDRPVVVCDKQELVWDLGIFIASINACTSPEILDSSDKTSLHLSHDTSFRLSSGWMKWTPTDLF